MLIIGCDYHAAFQQITFVDPDGSEFQERRFQHRRFTTGVYSFSRSRPGCI